MAVAGKGGQVKVGANVVAEIDDWKLDIQAAELDTTNFGSNGWKEYIAGLKEWSGSLAGNWDISGDVTGQKALQDALLGGTTVNISLSANGGTNNYTGTALVKKVAPEAPVKDKVKVTFDFTGTGALAYA